MIVEPILSFCDLHEAPLNKLCRSSHGVRVYFYAGKQIGVAPAVYPGGRSAQLHTHTTCHQIPNQIFVRISGRDVSINIVGFIVQGGMSGICVKDGNNFGL